MGHICKVTSRILMKAGAFLVPRVNPPLLTLGSTYGALYPYEFLAPYTI